MAHSLAYTAPQATVLPAGLSSHCGNRQCLIGISRAAPLTPGLRFLGAPNVVGTHGEIYLHRLPLSGTAAVA